MTTAELPLTWTRPKEQSAFVRVPISKIDIPPEFERQDLVTDDATAKSIADSGVNVPVNLYRKGDRFVLIKGGRRVRLAEKNGLQDVPAMIEAIPDGWTEEQFRSRLRFILTNLRQDLRPSQKAQIVRQTMQLFNLTAKQVAALTGWNEGSVSNWLAVERYVPEIVVAIDAGEVNSFQCRAYDGMTPEGQRKVFRELRKEMHTLAGGDFHRLVRSKFGPDKHPALYVNADRTKEKLARKLKGRKATKRPRLTRDEKEALSQSVEVAETELEELQKDIARTKLECRLAGPPCAVIMRNKTLREMLSPDMLAELERFIELPY